VSPDTTGIRALRPDEAPLFVELRREALAEAPLAFAASPEDDRGLSAEFMRESLSDPDSAAVLGAFEGDRLVGIAGVGRLSKRKQRHRAIVWGMYVSPPARGRGLGLDLLQAAVNRARSWTGVLQVQLSVTDAAPEARRLYERAGFREWGVEPRSLGEEGQFVAERHLVLDLD
jgi:GNAT superfamily N-acetyltransferase